VTYNTHIVIIIVTRSNLKLIGILQTIILPEFRHPSKKSMHYLFIWFSPNVLCFLHWAKQLCAWGSNTDLWLCVDWL